MRTFIAIELPKEIRERLFQLQSLLKRSGGDVKWVKPDNIHLTLKFLGEIDETKSGQIINITNEISAAFKPFRVSLSTIGAFPKIESPRVIWVAIAKGDSEVKLLAKGLEEKLEKLCVAKEERPFSSHITISRVRSGQNKDKLTKALKESENYFTKENTEFTVRGITLFKSTLGPGGPSYEPLHTASFATT